MSIEPNTRPHKRLAADRVLFLVPNLNSAGGVANYYRLVLPLLRAQPNGVQIDHLEMPVRRKLRFAKLFQLAEWLLFTIKFMAYLLVQRPDLTVFNPSLTRFCLLRDGILINFLHKINSRCRTLVFFRGWNIANEKYLFGPRAHWVTAQLLRSDVILSLTAHSQKVLAELVGKDTRLQQFQTVVDPDLQAYLEAQPPYQKVPESYLFLGNVAKEKGIFELLEAFRSFSAARPSARLTICGEGAALDAVSAYIETHGLRDVIETTGAVYGPEKFRRLAEAEVFVLPSYTEGMPNAVLEALSAECLVLSTPVGALGQFIERGYIAPLEVRSAESIRTALMGTDVLRQKIDRTSIAKAVTQQFGMSATLEFFDVQFRGCVAAKDFPRVAENKYQ